MLKKYPIVWTQRNNENYRIRWESPIFFNSSKICITDLINANTKRETVKNERKKPLWRVRVFFLSKILLKKRIIVRIISLIQDLCFKNFFLKEFPYFRENNFQKRIRGWYQTLTLRAMLLIAYMQRKSFWVGCAHYGLSMLMAKTKLKAFSSLRKHPKTAKRKGKNMRTIKTSNSKV